MNASLSDLPTWRAADVPAVSRAQMQEVDRLMIEEYGIELLQMMENAGLQLAEIVRRQLGEPLAGRRVALLAGSGNNGGGGLTAARRLSAWGAGVRVVLSGPPAALRGPPAKQLAVLTKIGVPIEQFAGGLPDHELLIDAIIGYSLQGAPRGAASEMIQACNRSPAPAVSLDVPSGVDVDSGQAAAVAVNAAATVTLALPKIGLLQSGERLYVGQLYLADIGVPPGLYSELGLDVPQLFDRGPLTLIDTSSIPA